MKKKQHDEMPLKLDAHQHYWDPSRGDYHWMPRDNQTLFRKYEPTDLKPHLDKAKIDGTIVVQAASTVAETDYLLDLAHNNHSIKGVVGWINFEDPTQHETLVRLSKHPKFKGVRPMIQDIPDVDWMLRDNLSWAFEALIDLDLTFDALGFPQHLPIFLTLMQRHPTLRMVIDHGMKPAIRDAQIGKDAFSAWASGMEKLASKTSSYCKISGLVTEATEGWTIDDIKPFTDYVLDAFGTDRVMWGSDWPVCRLQSEYDDWVTLSETLTRHLTDEQRHDVFGRTAAQFYQVT